MTRAHKTMSWQFWNNRATWHFLSGSKLQPHSHIWSPQESALKANWGLWWHLVRESSFILRPPPYIHFPDKNLTILEILEMAHLTTWGGPFIKGEGKVVLWLPSICMQSHWQTHMHDKSHTQAHMVKKKNSKIEKKNPTLLLLVCY